MIVTCVCELGYACVGCICALVCLYPMKECGASISGHRTIETYNESSQPPAMPSRSDPNLLAPLLCGERRTRINHYSQHTQGRTQMHHRIGAFTTCTQACIAQSDHSVALGTHTHDRMIAYSELATRGACCFCCWGCGVPQDPAPGCTRAVGAAGCWCGCAAWR